MRRDKENSVKLAEANTRTAFQDEVAQKDAEIVELKAKIEESGTSKILAVTEAVAKVEEERDALASDLKSKEIEKQLAVSDAVNKIENRL